MALWLPVMKTPRPDQEDLIRLILQEERFVYDEINTGHEDAAESKGPDQEDLDQRYTEKRRGHSHCKS